jgi:hypothetical protein
MVHVNDYLKATFIHIPKCGGIYISKLLENFYNFENIIKGKNINCGELLDCTIYDLHNFGRYRYYNKHQCVVDKPYILENYFSFTFIRNPYDRIFSAYSFLKKWINGEVNISAIKDNPDFFVNFTTFIQNYKNVNNTSYYYAFVTQIDHLINENKSININYIGKFEYLNNELINILIMLGIKDLKHIDKIYFDKKENVSTPIDKNEYTKDAFLFVNDFFENDFKCLNYKRYDTYEDFLYYHFRENNSIIDTFNVSNINLLYTNYNLLYYENILNKEKNNFYVVKIIEIFEIFKNEFKYNSNIINLLEQFKTITFQNINNFENFDKFKNVTHDIIFEMNYIELNKNIKKCNICNNIFMNLLSYNIHKYFCID